MVTYTVYYVDKASACSMPWSVFDRERLFDIYYSDYLSDYTDRKRIQGRIGITLHNFLYGTTQQVQR